MSDVPCQAIWWRADCEVESDLSLERQSQLFTVPHRWLVPRGQPQPYDPFDFYYPAKEAQKDRRSLPYLFTDLCPDNPEQVRSFCSRFGITGPFQDLTWQKWNQGSRDPSATRLEEGHLAGNPDRTVLRPMALAEIEKAWCKFKNFMVAAQSVKQDRLATGWITDDDKHHRLHGWLKPAFDVSHGSGQLEGWAWAVPSTVGEARRLLEHMFAEVCGRTRARMAWASSAPTVGVDLGEPGPDQPHVCDGGDGSPGSGVDPFVRWVRADLSGRASGQALLLIRMSEPNEGQTLLPRSRSGEAS